MNEPAPCTRRHHLTCGCRLTPPDFAAYLQRCGYAPAQIEEILIGTNLGHRPQMPSNARHNRSRSYLTPPDAGGHVHWAGPMPRRGLPRVTVDGRRLSLIHFAFREAGKFDVEADWPLRRNTILCRDEQCYAPAHWDLQTSRGPEPVIADNSALLALWDAEHPRPFDPHISSWTFMGVGLGDVCKAGHRVNVHRGDLKSAYCPTCYQHLKAWKQARTQYRVDLAAGARLSPATSAALREYLHVDDPAPASPQPDEPLPTMAEAIDQMLREIP